MAKNLLIGIICTVQLHSLYYVGYRLDLVSDLSQQEEEHSSWSET